MGMSNYKEAVKQIRCFLLSEPWLQDWMDENLNDTPEADWDAAEWADKAITQPVMKILCEYAGHQIIADQCGMAKHDFCCYCMEQFPGQAEGRGTEWCKCWNGKIRVSVGEDDCVWESCPYCEGRCANTYGEWEE